MNVSENNSEKCLVLDLILSNGFKAQNIPTLACHVALSIGMDKRKRMNKNSVITLEHFLSHRKADTTLIILIVENKANDNRNTNI